MSIIHRAIAYLAALLHPYTIGRTIVATGRGIIIVATTTQAYVSADDRSHLRDANPTRHDRITRKRAWAVGIGAGCDLVSFIACWYFLSRPGIAIWVLTHLVAFFLIGRNAPVLQQVQTAWTAGEARIKRLVEDITGTAESRKLEEHAQILSPVSRLASGKGWEVTVSVSEHAKPDALADGARVLAQKMKKAKGTVFVYPLASDMSAFRILGLDTNPWTEPPTSSPLVNAPREVNLWREPVNLGIFPDASPYMMTLVEEGDGGGLLCGAAPRVGKTTLFRGFMVPIMLHPGSRMHVIDGKGVDFKPIEPVCATYIADPTMENIQLLRASMKVLRMLETEVNRRRVMLLSAGHVHLTEDLCRELGLTLEWGIIDELAVITEDLLDKHGKEVKAFQTLLGWLVRMGPAFGVFFLLATQRPSEKVIPATVRSMIVRRIALYIADVSGAQSITGKAGKQYRADWLDPKQKGVAIVVGVGQMRFHNVTHNDLKALVQYAQQVRSQTVMIGAQIHREYPELIKNILDVFHVKHDPPALPTWCILAGLMEQGIDHSAVSLAAELKPYGITSKQIRYETKQAWGYHLSALTNAPSHSAGALPSQDITDMGRDGRVTDSRDGTHSVTESDDNPGMAAHTEDDQ